MASASRTRPAEEPKKVSVELEGGDRLVRPLSRGGIEPAPRNGHRRPAARDVADLQPAELPKGFDHE